MKRVLLTILGLLLINYQSISQTTIVSTGTSASYWSATTGCIVFAVQNTNSSGITITDLSNYMPANNTNTFSLWYHPTNLLGVPPDITTANGWVLAKTGSSVTSPSTVGVVPVLNTINLSIPANTTYRVALVGSVSSPYYATSGSSPALVSGGGVNIHTQASTISPTYVGYFPGAITTTPRGFYGTLTFTSLPAVPPGCVSSPLAPANNATTICSGTTILRWNKVSGATGYDVYLNQSSAAPTTIVSTNQVDTFFSATTAVGPYTWKIVPRNTIGAATGCGFFNFTTITGITPTAAISVAPKDSVCIDVPVTFTATITNGGSAPVYQWKKNNTNVGTNSPNFTDNSVANNDNYKVVVTSNATGCLTTTTATSNQISMHILPTPTTTIAAGGPTAFCNGGSVTLNTAAGALNYQWLNGSNPLAGANANNYVAMYSGYYKVRVVGAGNACPSISDSIRVTVYQNPLPRVNRNGNTLSTDPVYANYQWYKGILPIPGATGSSYSFTNDGQYSVKVTDTAGCMGSSVYLPVNNLAVKNGILTNINVYPNPASNVVFIDAPMGVNIIIRSMDGKIVVDQREAKKVDLSKLSAGIYILSIMNDQMEVLRIEKLLKKD